MTVRVLGPGGPLEAAARPGQTWLEFLFELGLFPRQPVCAGAGLCGACRIRFAAAAPAPLPEEVRRLDPAALAEGWRLACRHLPREGQVVAAPAPLQEAALPAPSARLLAVDIGTTALKWAVADPDHGPFSVPNPQLPAGSEVLSRVRYATASPAGAETLRRPVLEAIQAMAAGGVAELVLTGNTVMLALLLGLPVAGLGAAPYRMPVFGGSLCLVPDLPPAYVPPPLAPFVGSDITAGVVACLQAGLPVPFLLVDLGTNGEMAWYDGQRLVVTSVPMGPAVEGVGLRWGRLAGPGVVGAVDVGPAGIVPRGQGPWQGISGTGYVALLAALRRLGALDARGHFVESPPSPLARRVLAGLRAAEDGRWLPVAGPVEMGEADVEEFLKVKAAAVAALAALLRRAGGVVASVAVAGALGSHVAVDDLITLGFFPPAWRGRIRVLGNTSLQGGLLLGCQPELRALAEDLPRRVEVVDAVAERDFSTHYLTAMHLGAWGEEGLHGS